MIPRDKENKGVIKYEENIPHTFEESNTRLHWNSFTIRKSSPDFEVRKLDRL